MSQGTLSQIGARGLVIYDGTEYFFVNESDWRKLPAYGLDSARPVAELVNLSAAVATLKESPAAIFVDLDRLTELPATQGSAATSAPPTSGALPSFTGENVVLREGANVVPVPRTAWKKLDTGLSGDAKVLVNRGAVVAAIPQNHVPQGTFCVLVNFSALTKTT
jgi:hypothetical protein